MGNAPLPLKKQLESSVIETGACQFCGQIMHFETSGESTFEKLTAWATEKCDCDGAKEFRNEGKRKKKIEMNIRAKFEDVNPTMSEILLESVEPVMKGLISGITIKDDFGFQGSMQLSSKGSVIVKKKKVIEEASEG